MYQQPNSENPHLTTETRQFLDELAKQKAAPLDTLSYEEARKVLLGAQNQTEITARLTCDIQDTLFPVGPNGRVDVRFYRPQNNHEVLPLVVYYHGGGWVMGNKKTHERLMRELCIGSGCAILFVNYLSSPEGQYPNVLEEGYDALEYVIHHAADYHVNPNAVLVAGDSVGGNMAAVLSLMSKERHGPALSKQILLYPVTDASMSSPSYRDFANGPWLTQKAMAYFWDAYAPNTNVRQEIYASPINASTEQLAGLPPAFIITAENDVLRDEGEVYADKLMQAGNSVTAVRYKGTIHDFMMLDGLAQTTPAQAAIKQTIAEIKAAF